MHYEVDLAPTAFLKIVREQHGRLLLLEMTSALAQLPNDKWLVCYRFAKWKQLHEQNIIDELGSELLGGKNMCLFT